MPDLVLKITDSASSSIFDTFFSAYEAAFVLPDEKETREGFSECLNLNHGSAHAQLVNRYGAFRELCVTAHDAKGLLIGGANFIVMAHSGSGPVTANLNYIFIERSVRGSGWLRKLLRAVRELIDSTFQSQSRALIFIEQNDPLLMSQEAYRIDSKVAGIDQFDRLRIWSKLGALVVDFPYAQPPLSVEQEADRGLIYSVMGAESYNLDACVLRDHLKAFFGISVLKGKDLLLVDVAKRQVADLTQRCGEGLYLSLLDPTKQLSGLDKDSEIRLRINLNVPFREWLRNGTSSSF